MTVSSSLEQRKKEGQSCDVQDSKCQNFTLLWFSKNFCACTCHIFFFHSSLFLFMRVCTHVHTCTVHMNICGTELFLRGHPPISWISSLENCSVHLPIDWLMGSFGGFFMLNFLSSLYILNIRPLPATWQKFPPFHCVNCFLHWAETL